MNLVSYMFRPDLISMQWLAYHPPQCLWWASHPSIWKTLLPVVLCVSTCWLPSQPVKMAFPFKLVQNPKLPWTCVLFLPLYLHPTIIVLIAPSKYCQPSTHPVLRTSMPLPWGLHSFDSLHTFFLPASYLLPPWLHAHTISPVLTIFSFPFPCTFLHCAQYRSAL